MRRIYFHTRERTVGIGGRERAWFGSLCAQMMRGVLDLHGFMIDDEVRKYRRMLALDHYVARETDGSRFIQMLETALSGFDDLLRWNDQAIRTFSLQLNTALVLGSDAVKLAARIHGQCEIHGWVNGPDRAWLASIVEQGIRDEIMRPDIGQPPHEWPDVVAMLRQSDRDEVVMSYSVCDQFPNATVAGYGNPDDFYELDESEQWARSMAGLRARGSDDLELKPDGWHEFRFTHGLSALDLVAHDWEARLEAKFPRQDTTVAG